MSMLDHTRCEVLLPDLPLVILAQKSAIKANPTFAGCQRKIDPSGGASDLIAQG